MTLIKQQFLIATLGPKLSLRLADSLSDEIETNGLQLKRREESFIGFYDGIRNKNKEVIGIRLGVASDEIEEFIKGKIPSYVHQEMPVSNSILEICWTNREEIIEEFSDDQAMGSHGLYWDGASTIGFYFEISSLYSSDFIVNEIFEHR